MRLTVREVPYDLYAIIVLSTLLVLSIVILPDATVLRVVLGLPFLLFYPGYVLISALYPEKKLYYDGEGRKLPGRPEVTEGDQEDGDEEGPSKGASKVTGKGLDDLERVALSLGLSIAVTPLIGLVLNWTYDWDPHHLGIRLWLVASAIYLFNVIGAGVAAYRRSRVPLDERFAIELAISLPKDSSPLDRALTVGIAVMMVLSVSLLIYIIVVPRQGEAFTEFYVLGPTRKADGYPSSFTIEEPQSIHIGIGNHERGDRNYTIILSVSAEGRNITVNSLDSVRVSMSERPALEVRVKKGGTLILPCNFTIGDTGHHKLRLLLYMDDREYRDLHLWVRVFESGQLAVDPQTGTKLFAAGEGGDPSRLGTIDPVNGRLTLTIGLVNPSTKDIAFNVTVHLQGPYKALPYGPDGPALISPGTGTYMTINARARTTTVSSDLLLSIDSGGGPGLLIVETMTENLTLSVSHKVVPDI